MSRRITTVLYGTSHFDVRALRWWAKQPGTNVEMRYGNIMPDGTIKPQWLVVMDEGDLEAARVAYEIVVTQRDCTVKWHKEGVFSI